MNRNLSIVFSIFLLVGIIVPAYAQTNYDNVVINEVDINPFGDDSVNVNEWIELYNPTDSDIDLGGWEIASTTGIKKTMTISSGTIIKSGEFLTYQYQTVWFTDVSESVELRDENGIVIDKTPVISDIQNDFTSWQRIYDGYDLDSYDDWKFVTSTIGSSNGKLVEIQESTEITVTVSSEKSSYLFGDVAVITGSISEEVFVYKPIFQPEQIIVTISSGNFYKTVTLYPDLNLNYETTLSLHQVLGINEGTYDVSVNYAGATANTNFSVGVELIEQETTESGSFSIVTDNTQYIPGQQVSITGFTTEIIPFQGMKFSVKDSQRNIIYSGTLFPTNGEFTTSIFLTTINPNYGTYEIIAEYFDKAALTTFEVVEDFKESVLISLWTDKEAYGLGEEVKITGRLNQVWISSLDLEIIDTKQSAIVTSSSGSPSGFKIQSVLTVMGDGSFSYTFILPNDEIRLGDYRITVSKDLGSVTKIIHVVTNPDDFIASDEPLTILSDKEIYELGDKMIISGSIKDPFGNSSYQTGSSVKISISRADGTPLEIIGLPKEFRTHEVGGVVVALDFTAIPETSGKYSVQIDVAKLIFADGNYVVKATYLGDIATKTFTVIDPLDLNKGISLDKEVYGPGETVYLTGLLPPTGATNADILLTKSDGTVMSSGTLIDNQRFSWSWTTPLTEKIIKTDAGRDATLSNFGIYKIKVTIDSLDMDIFFKVSLDPENDSLSKTPLFVTTEKSLYKVGEKLKVIGNVIKRDQGDQGLVVPERVHIRILDGTFPYSQIHESSVYPNQGGEFSSIFELPITIFTQGTYTVKALYTTTRAETTFGVVTDLVFNPDDPLSLLVSTDKSVYYPGDTVIITGNPNNPIYLENFDVSVIQKADADITCANFSCGIHTGPVTSIRTSPFGSFTHEFVIPNSMSAVGSYEITVDADFEIKRIQFDVIEKPQTLKLNTVIEKENRIPGKIISILTEEKIVDNVSIAPRVLSGSLITTSRADESNVNLKISTATGICIIGPDADCLVKESTRKQGQIYDVVEVDGISLNVRYSGPDVRLEKFSILPKSSTAFLPDANWNVEVIKDDQVSRFYYKVTYKVLE